VARNFFEVDPALMFLLNNTSKCENCVDNENFPQQYLEIEMLPGNVLLAASVANGP